MIIDDDDDDDIDDDIDDIDNNFFEESKLYQMKILSQLLLK